MLRQIKNRVIKIPLCKRAMSWAGSRVILRNPVGQFPSLDWKILPPGSGPRLDAASARIGSQLFVIGGFASWDKVCGRVEVLDLARGRWMEPFDMPPDMPQSHLAVTTDGQQYIYTAGGQMGNQCSPAVASAFVLDVKSRAWQRLPPLPAPRYAGTMQLWNGRLHLIGGAKEDRYTPAADHWSLAVEHGKAREAQWREESPVPRGGMHRASIVAGGALYVLGGQEGDFIPIPGDPKFTCTGNTRETVYPDVFRLDAPGGPWQSLPDMPIPSSHIEFSVLTDGRRIMIAGGSVFKHPETFAIELTAAVQAYDTVRGEWAVIGALPYRVKTNVCAFYEGWLYTAFGQRDVGPGDPHPGRIEDRVWRARLPREGGPRAQAV